jgi:hypothetical protein
MTRAPRVIGYLTYGLLAVFTLFGAAFIIGETATDPGGLAAALLSACWAVPMMVAAAYAVWRPDPAATVLTVVAVIVAAFVVIDRLVGIVPRGVGPVGTICAFAVAVALGFLGLRRPGRAGGLLLLVGAVSIVGGASGTAVAIPVLAIGSLYLLTASLGSGPHRSDHSGRSHRGPLTAGR